MLLRIPFSAVKCQHLVIHDIPVTVVFYVAQRTQLHLFLVYDAPLKY